MRRWLWNSVAGAALFLGACAGLLGETVALLLACFACCGAYWMGERGNAQASDHQAHE